MRKLQLLNNNLVCSSFPQFMGRYNVKCNGGSNGRISSQVVGGTSPYTYNWSNGAATPNIANVPAGNYLLSVTDAAGSNVSSYISLNQPRPLTTHVIKSVYGDYNTTQGLNNGSIALKPIGGVSPFEYFWSNRKTRESNDNLFAGTYTYTIKDIYNCTVSGSATLTQPPPLAATASVLQAPACGNTVLGIIKANVTGGDPPYGITWNNSNKGDTAFNLLEGPIEFTVIDESRGMLTITTNLQQASQPMLLQLTPTVYPNGRNTSCYSCLNGIIQTSITGGLAPFAYNWQPVGLTTATINNLAGGQYTLTVTDNSGCVASAERDVNTFNLWADGRMEIGGTKNTFNNSTFLRVNGGVVIGSESDYGSLIYISFS